MGESSGEMAGKLKILLRKELIEHRFNGTAVLG
jgi:hypothetical protein